ncbi:daunorubicin resistance protein DrrA family ABC transporter ATP-binding protein [Streptomyces mashuensis]|uniref:Daunorubicin resistance protein DrrA family ABC transporter ATP-binding protein n=1 Tax=Streptomyces mashuensis TaxID=33904 RepID=A0A919B3W7_9ACTN|nr:ATP-binding cassette domain-containing protein [Streptomyces mashuensis]GHF48195.1 daunorubicin resistance protein DrrA family ABC transporter ATP-binding protein [Streptomyces mashuensis]
MSGEARFTDLSVRDAPGAAGAGLTAPSVSVLARGLRKSYPGVEAVRGVDLTVRAGETFGFLGPNGAGKSTTIAMLCTLARPTAGRATVAGADVTADPAAVRRRIGLVFQDLTVDGDLTAAENLRFHADLYGLPHRTARRRVAEMLDLVGLHGRRHSLVRTFSGGMKRRLEIARGLLHAPRVLFLDEPTVGLDPQTRAQVWDHLHRVRQQRAVTLFLTTHHLEEAEHCDRIAVIDDGRIVTEGTPAALKAAIGTDRVVLHTTDDAAARTALGERFGLAARRDPEGLLLHVPDGAAFVPVLCARLGVPVLSVTVTRPSLDDVFLHCTGRTIRDADGTR